LEQLKLSPSGRCNARVKKNSIDKSLDRSKIVFQIASLDFVAPFGLLTSFSLDRALMFAPVTEVIS
jgi:hypothetical protein